MQVLVCFKVSFVMVNSSPLSKIFFEQMCSQTKAIVPGGATHCLEYHVYDIGGYFANDKEHASHRSGARSIETDLDGAAAYRSNEFEQLLRVSS